MRHVALPKPPTAVVLSRDGQTLFIGLDGRFGGDGAIAVYHRNGDTFSEVSELPVPQGVSSLAVTSDEQTVVATTPTGLIAVKASSLSRGTPATTIVRDGDAPGTNQLVISADNRYVFYTNSRDSNLGVARLTVGATTNAPDLAIVGHVSLDRVPGGLALSRDGTSIFVTSEIDNVDPATVTAADDSRLGRTTCAVNFGPNGVLTVISAELAIHAPRRAVLARTAAGCAPVRVALSPDGAVAWVSDRGEARVLAFDVARMRRHTNALLATVAVGTDPVGLAVSRDGRDVLVANSNHSVETERGTTGTLSLLDVKAILHGGGSAAVTLRAGERPREVVSTGNGDFFVTDYEGRSIDLVAPAPRPSPAPSP